MGSKKPVELHPVPAYDIHKICVKIRELEARISKLEMRPDNIVFKPIDLWETKPIVLLREMNKHALSEQSKSTTKHKE